MDLRLRDIVAAVKGMTTRGFEDARVSGLPVPGVSIDTRNISAGEVFFALRGEHTDGHNFIKQAFSMGASATVIDRPAMLEEFCDRPMILVKDALTALGDLASHIRGLYKTPLVAVTGSSGKTTTKDMIALILGAAMPVLKTEGNFNNLIGLPLTLFRLEGSHRAAVVELGISEQWEMPRLAGICRPDIALITNIGHAHLRTLGSIEDAAKAKTALFSALGPEGIRIVNLDDERLKGFAEGKGNKVTFSMKGDADVRVSGYGALGDFSGIDVTYGIRGKALSLRLNSPSAASVLNSVAAIAACLPLGASFEDIRRGLEGFSHAKGRMEVLRFNGLTILDDTYNANPESVAMALRTLSFAGGRKIAVLGEMLELGPASEAEHRAIGRIAVDRGIDLVVVIGNRAEDIAKGALTEGIKGLTVLCFKDKPEAIDALARILRKGDTVLVKGSRAVGLEDVVYGMRCFSPAVQGAGYMN